MRVLGVETSCDETGVALYEAGGIRAERLASQTAIHAAYGGVVPELASREHLAKIGNIVNEALSRAQVSARDVDGLAVTCGPGLIGSLLVGINYAKGFAFALKKPIVGVNHIEGHIYSVSFDFPPPVFPALALVVSGGPPTFSYSLTGALQTRRANSR